MNAQTLFDIVKDVPEAWPRGLVWAPIAEKFFLDEIDPAIPDDHAELMFEASMARVRDLGTVETASGYRAFNRMGLYETDWFPTRVAALASARGKAEGGCSK